MKHSKVGKPSLKTVIGEGASEQIQMSVAGEVYMISNDVKHHGISRDPGQAKAHMITPSDKGDGHEDGSLHRKP